MFDSEKKDFIAVMSATCQLYNKPRMDGCVLRLYWLALRHLSLAEIKQSINHHVRNPDTGMFLPKPADIIRHLEGSRDSQAKRAWTLVDQAMRCYGAWESVRFIDKRIHAVIVDMGGWIKLCNTLEKDYPFKQNEFEKRYQRYLQVEPVHVPETLIGIAQAQNQAKGLPVAAAVLIGVDKRNTTPKQEAVLLLAQQDEKQLLH